MSEGRIYKVQSLFMKNSCRWFYYLKEGLELFMREERIYIVQSFFMDNLLPQGGSGIVDKGGEVLLHGELLKVIILPEGGSGTVDKGGEDLHCAVFLHGQLF